MMTREERSTYNCAYVRHRLRVRDTRFAAQLDLAVRVVKDEPGIPDREILSRQLAVTADSITELNVAECRAEAYRYATPTHQT